MTLIRFCLLWTVLLTASVATAVPQLVHYRGFLTDLDGLPVHCPDVWSCEGGPYTVDVALYALKEGGEALWAQSHTEVVLRDGVFELALGTDGESSALSEALALTDSLYLGISINGGAELLPRQRLAASAWALLDVLLYSEAQGELQRGAEGPAQRRVAGDARRFPAETCRRGAQRPPLED